MSSRSFGQLAHDAIVAGTRNAASCLVDRARELEVAEVAAVELGVAAPRRYRQLMARTSAGRDDRVLSPGDHQRRDVDGTRAVRCCRAVPPSLAAQTRSPRACSAGCGRAPGRRCAPPPEHAVLEQAGDHRLDDRFDRLLAFHHVCHREAVVARAWQCPQRRACCRARARGSAPAPAATRRRRGTRPSRVRQRRQRSMSSESRAPSTAAAKLVERRIALRRRWRIAATPEVNAHAAHVTGQGSDLVVPLRRIERECVEEQHRFASSRVVDGRQHRLSARASGLSADHDGGEILVEGRAARCACARASRRRGA